MGSPYPARHLVMLTRGKEAKIMSEASTVTTDDVAIRELSDPAVVAVRELQARVEDGAVRESRRRGWCTEFSQVLSAMFPDGPVDQTECQECYNIGQQNPPWRDSDGADCNGHIWRDSDGYDRTGFDVVGWNREGVNAAGERKDDPARYRYNRHGFDINGYNPDGLNRHGYTRERQAEDSIYARDIDGLFRDVDGFDYRGYNAAGEYQRDKRRDY